MTRTSPPKRNAKTWDGDRFKPRCVRKQVEPNPNTRERDIALLEKKLRATEALLTSSGDVSDDAASNVESHAVEILLFDDRHLEFRGASLKALISKAVHHFSASKDRWRKAQYSLAGSCSVSFDNPLCLTRHRMTDGVQEWTETSWSVGEDVSSSPALSIHVPTPAQKIAQSRRWLESLPPLKDCREDNQSEPAFVGWIELKSGKRIEFAADEYSELKSKLKVATAKHGRRVVSTGDSAIPRRFRAEVHPLQAHRTRIEHAIELSEELLKERNASDLVARAWGLGLELGFAWLNYERQSAIPRNFRAAEMDHAKAGSKPKPRKRERLDDALAHWMQQRGVRKEDTNKQIAGEFWDFAKKHTKSFKCSGTELKGKIRHVGDEEGYSCQHLARNVVRELREMIQRNAIHCTP